MVQSTAPTSGFSARSGLGSVTSVARGALGAAPRYDVDPLRLNEVKLMTKAAARLDTLSRASSSRGHVSIEASLDFPDPHPSIFPHNTLEGIMVIPSLRTTRRSIMKDVITTDELSSAQLQIEDLVPDGVELSEEEIRAVSGGGCTYTWGHSEWICQ